MERLSFEAIRDLEDVFGLLDTEKANRLTAANLFSFFKAFDASTAITETDLEHVVSELDMEGNGHIDFYDFLVMMCKKRTQAEIHDELMEVLKSMDKDKDGVISAVEVNSIMNNLGLKLSPMELETMLREFDVDGNGEIDFEEFTRILLQKY